jgi:hypothetical protein
MRHFLSPWRLEPEHVEDLHEQEATQLEEAKANDTIPYNIESTTR